MHNHFVFIAGLLVSAGLLLIAARGASAQSSDQVVEPLTIVLPLAEQSVDGEGCKTASELTDANARAYGEHLAGRFNTSVTLCLARDSAGVLDMASAPGASLVWTDQATAMVLPGDWRATMALRDGAGLGRTPFVLFGLRSDVPATLDAGALQRIGMLTQPPAHVHLDSVRTILGDYELKANASEVAFSSMPDLFSAVDQGEVDAAIVDASMWGAGCNVLDADSTVCDGYEILMYDRPRATYAFMVPSDTSVERRHRLTGVHITLHIERPDLFAWLSQGDGSEFEPAEASAIAPKSLDTAIAF